MMKKASLATIVALSLTACAETTTMVEVEEDPLTAAVSGKSFQAGNSVFTASENGALSGTGPNGMVFKGAWAIRDGKWCRTLTEPAEFAGTECQTAELGDNTITITGRNGPIVWTFL